MRSLVLGAATAIAMATSVGVKAADLAYPPPIAGPPQYGEVAPPAVVPPQVIVVPGPMAVPQYNGASVPPPLVGPSYGVPPPVAAGVAVAPRRPCAPVIAVGRRVAHRILNATPPPTSRSARRSTQVLKFRRLQTLIPASTCRECTPVQLVRFLSITVHRFRLR